MLPGRYRVFRRRAVRITKQYYSTAIHPLQEPPEYPGVQFTSDNVDEYLTRSVAPLRHIPYLEQLDMKNKWVSYLVSQYRTMYTDECKASGVYAPMPLPKVANVQPSAILERYRNKDAFVVRPGFDGNPKTVGFLIGKLSKHHQCVCIPPSEVLTRSSHVQVAKAFQEYIRSSPLQACLDFKDVNGYWKGVIVRSNEDGNTMAVVDMHPRDLSEEQLHEERENLRQYFVEGPGSECNLSSLYFQACPHTTCSSKVAPYHLLHGATHLKEKLSGRVFALSPASFFQVNTKMAEVLYDQILTLANLDQQTTFLDLCCGIGTISVLAAPFVRGCVGIDILEDGINDAKHNAELNHITSANFIHGSVERQIGNVLGDLDHSPNIVSVLNPGRAGINWSVIRAIRAMPQIRKLLYVACAAYHPGVIGNIMQLMLPPSKKNIGTPFRMKKVVPVDMFPNTPHVEVIFSLQR